MVKDKEFTSDLWKESKEQNSLILFTSLDFIHGKVSHVVDKRVARRKQETGGPKNKSS